MTSYHSYWLAAAVACCAPLLPLSAQRPTATPTQRQVDSLAMELRRLQARFDSVLIVLARLQAAGPARGDTGLAAARADSAAAQDELATLRAAAAAAAGQADTADTAGAARADSARIRELGGRPRNLSQLNPELSVTADIRAYTRQAGSRTDSFDPREFEFSFQSAVDPYSYTKIFVSVEGGEVAIEEGYIYRTGLPGRLRVDFGKFRQQLGEVNRWHLHAVPETEYPLALTTYTGEDGLAGTGVSLYWAAPLTGALGTHEVYAQATRVAEDVWLAGSGRPSVLLHLNNFWQISPATYLQIGGTGLYGTNPDSGLRVRLGGLDVRWTWRPPARALYREWTIRSELFIVHRERGGSGKTRYGGYVGTSYKFNRRWSAGARYDYVEAPEGPLTVTRQLVPVITFLQSEFMRLRLQYRYARSTTTSPTHELSVQALWAIGPHRDEIF